MSRRFVEEILVEDDAEAEWEDGRRSKQMLGTVVLAVAVVGAIALLAWVVGGLLR